MIHTNNLAREFSRLVRATITDPRMVAYIEHHADPNDAICPTADVCDSNLLMDEAFTKVVGHGIDLQSSDDAELWNNAWTTAKVYKFRPDEIPTT